MLKRIFDIVVSFFGLVITSPILIPVIILIWLQDFHSPFYIAPRVGKNKKIFRMIKLRSMIVNADSTGVDSTSADDKRITTIGKIVRAFKLDELTQLCNVLKGDMSIVGPRPSVKRETDLYTKIEKNLLTVKPGITDFSSIVFSDEGDILKGSDDPDIRYNQLIRPWKSRLGLFYIEKQSFEIDIMLIIYTAMVIFSRKKALKLIERLLNKLGADKTLIEVVKREKELSPYPPPGSDKIVVSRNI